MLGAPEFILGAGGYAPYRSIAEEAMADGSRVLLFAACKPGPNGRGISSPCLLAFVLLRNPVRENAKETFAYFHDQGVTVKVISGDNPVTVSAAAREAGIVGRNGISTPPPWRLTRTLRRPARNTTYLAG